MKKLMVAILAVMFVLSGCSSSKKYVGTWIATKCSIGLAGFPQQNANGKCVLELNEDGSGYLRCSISSSDYSINDDYPIKWQYKNGKFDIVCTSSDDLEIKFGCTSSNYYYINFNKESLLVHAEGFEKY